MTEDEAHWRHALFIKLKSKKWPKAADVVGYAAVDKATYERWIKHTPPPARFRNRALVEAGLPNAMVVSMPIVADRGLSAGAVEIRTVSAPAPAPQAATAPESEPAEGDDVFADAVVRIVERDRLEGAQLARLIAVLPEAMAATLRHRQSKGKRVTATVGGVIAKFREAMPNA